MIHTFLIYTNYEASVTILDDKKLPNQIRERLEYTYNFRSGEMENTK